MVRRSRRPRPGFSGSLLISGLIVILAVAVGYAGTKYVIYPFLLNGGIKAEDTGTRAGAGGSGSDGADKAQPQTVKPTGSGVVTGEQKVTDLTPGAITPTSAAVSAPAPEKKPEGQISETLYSIQFGSFSAKEGAQAEKQALLSQGISAYIWENGGAFKVMGMPYLQKDRAKEAAGALKSALNDVYVASMTVPFPDENQKKTLNGLLDSYTAIEQSSDQSQAAVLASLQGPIIMMMEGLMQ